MVVVPVVRLGISRSTHKFVAIMDTNGVPRFHLEGSGGHFRAFSNGPTIDGRQVQYALAESEWLRAVRTEVSTAFEPSARPDGIHTTS